MPSKYDLSNWKPAHTSAISRDLIGRVTFNDGVGRDWHLLRIVDHDLSSRRLRLTITFKPTPQCTASLFVGHWGGVTVCAVSPTGEVRTPGIADTIECTKRPDGFLTAAITYWNSNEHIQFGSGTPHGHYLSQGIDQFIIESVDIQIVPEVARHYPDSERVVFVDVGARWGFSDSFKRMGSRVRPIMVEPDPAGAADLLEDARDFPGAELIPHALFNKSGPRKLYLTRNPGCSSLLEPNQAFVAGFTGADSFEVLRTIEVNCVRYDEYVAGGKMPKPDAIKIDVQGAEHQVLEGFGDLLHDCLGIELETHLYPLYLRQKLLTDLTKLLMKYGLMLHRMQHVGHFAPVLVEYNAWFLKMPGYFDGKDPLLADKMAFIRKAWGF